MSFDTERPKSQQELLEGLIAQKNTRVANRKALLEGISEQKAAKNADAILESAQVEVTEKARLSSVLESMKQTRIKERVAKSTVSDRLSLLENAKEITMNKVLFEMVYDAYWLDDNVKKESIQETYDEYKNVMAMLESTCGASKTKDKDKSKFIKAVEAVVSEACERATDRILKEAKESGNPNVDFNFTAEEEADLDKKLSELGRDDLVDMVKKKVLTVVQDERKAGKEKAEMLKDIEKTEDEQGDEISNESEESNDASSESDEGVSDNKSTKNTTALAQDMEMTYPEEMKNMKANIIGKSLESIQGSDYADGDDVKVGGSTNGVLYQYVSDKYKGNENVINLLNSCNSEDPEVVEKYNDAMKNPDTAIVKSFLKEYIGMLNKDRYLCMLKSGVGADCTADERAEASRVVTEQISNCQKIIRELPDQEDNPHVAQPRVTLETMIQSAQKRKLYNTMGGTLFESFMITNSNSAKESAVTEGVSIDSEQAANAALIESILQYTVLETLNTAQIYKFTANDVQAIKQCNRKKLAN